MAEQLIKVCDHPDEERGHKGEVLTYEVRLPSGVCVTLDLCRAHGGTIDDLAALGRRLPPGGRKRASTSGRRRGFTVTPVDQIG